MNHPEALFVLVILVHTAHVGAVLPYLRHYNYKQPVNPLVYSHTRPSPWLPSYPTQGFSTESTPSDTVLFKRVPLDSSLPQLDSSIPSVLTAIDPGTYYADWHRLLHGHTSQRCHPIPKNMSLCQRVGYDHMILPNYLQHEDLKEATEQSQVWVSLVHTECHPDLKRFLCALYAPVCLEEYQERLIEPCQDLCEDVRQSCLPKMLQFGFGWPDIVNCARFPKGSTKMCVPLTEKMRARCSGCVEKPTFESVMSSFCMADVALKARITSVTRTNSSTGLLYTLKLGRNPKVLKLNASLSSLSRLLFEVACECNLLEMSSNGESTRTAGWLIMGKLLKDRRTLQIEHLSRIRRKSQGVRRAIRAIRRSEPNLCRLTIPNVAPEKPVEESLDTLDSTQDIANISPQQDMDLEEDDLLMNSGSKKGPRLHRREERTLRVRKNRNSESMSTAQGHFRRNPQSNRRRSLVRRSQVYHKPFISPSTFSGPGSSTNRQWNAGPIKNSRPSAERISQNKIGKRPDSRQNDVTMYPLLESEKDLFSPQNLVPWLK
ncbi:Secreted frizzled- protein 2 [Clonorchis sinensis]|uniref:Secreted frizzled- protein 2 n=1 Tax=Clonorchis sinensis TaxID=79923 RepID=A0A8T1MTA2_CLOSI|nr:Secreted frizzled- protein 2 [Clonorchis sinensis]